MKSKYIIKPETKYMLKDLGLKNRDIANKLGVSQSYVSLVINGKRHNTSKLMAFAFCKAISTNLEIEDLFNIF